MRVISWNVRHGGGNRVAAIIDSLAAYEADVIVLVEFHQGPTGQALRFALDRLGFKNQATAPAGLKQNSVLVAARLPFAPLVLPGISESDGHRVVGVRFDDFDLFGFYFANQEAKIPLWQTLVAAAPALVQNRTLLVGDFNTGRHRFDETGSTFWCAEYFEALLAAGMVDAWRHTHGDATEWTWFSSHGNGFRLDHAFVTAPLLASLKAARYSHTEREARISDHSMLVVDLA